VESERAPVFYYWVSTSGKCRIFTNVVSIAFTPVFGNRDYCPPVTLLNVSVHQVFGRPCFLLPILMSLIDLAYAHLRWSILTTRLHSPPLPISTWNCEPLPRCPSLWFSLLFQHSSLCRSYNMQYSSFHLPLKFGASSFPSLWVTMFERRTIGREIRRIFGRLYLWFLEFVGQYKS
jgi:hypothetical protein